MLCAWVSHPLHKVIGFWNLNLRKGLRTFHIVYSDIHRCLLLICPEVIKLSKFLAGEFLSVLHSLFCMSIKFLDYYFSSWNNHFGCWLSDFREVLLKFIEVMLELLLLICCWEFQRLFGFRLDFAILFFVLVHHLLQSFFRCLLFILLLFLFGILARWLCRHKHYFLVGSRIPEIVIELALGFLNPWNHFPIF